MSDVVGGPERVVVLVKRFPRLSETFILNEFVELRRQGLPVELFAVMDPHEGHSQPRALELQPEVTYIQPGTLRALLPIAWRTARHHPTGTLRAVAWTINRHTRAAARNLVHATVLVDLLAKGRPAHLHAHFLHSPAALAVIAHQISGQPYSLTGHAKDIYTTLPQNLELRCREARFVTTCTSANADHLRRILAGSAAQVVLVRHGVDVTTFAGAERSPVPGRILSIGRLVPKKGFDVLIRACAELAERDMEFSLRIVGAGDLRDELVDLARELGIADRVSLLGSCTQAEVVNELAAAEVFALSPMVLPNGDRDGIPNVLLEAMAAGVPVVATSVSGIAEVITQATGLLVEEQHPELFADALATMLGDAGLRERLAAAAHSYVRDECNWRNAVRPFVELLGNCLAPVGMGSSARP